MARSLFDPAIFSLLGASGAIGVGYQLAFYTAGTTTQITTWNAATAGSANTNPVIADGNGRIPPIWIDQGQTIKYVLQDNNGVTLITADQVPVAAIPAAPDASLTGFLANSNPLPIANGGTNATTAASALNNLGALPLAGGTVTANIVRSTKGPHAFFHDAGITTPEIFIAPTGGADPRGGLPGQCWLRY